jgi:hypothetical protein
MKPEPFDLQSFMFCVLMPDALPEHVMYMPWLKELFAIFA